MRARRSSHNQSAAHRAWVRAAGAGLRVEHVARRAGLVAALLVMVERGPLVRVFSVLEIALRGPLGQLVRCAFPVVASAGVMHTLTGATQISSTPPSPVAAQVGTEIGVTFGLTGAVGTTPESYAVIGILPAGVSVSGATGPFGNLTVNAFAGAIVGTPTEAGTFTVQITAYDGPNRGAGTHGSFGPVNLTLIVAPNDAPPLFTTQPQPVTAAFGAAASFSVAVSGSPTPTLQWRRNAADLPGQTSATLALANVTSADAGSYDCVATNTQGTRVSTAAALTVTPPPAPTITTGPVAMVSRRGSGAFFSVQAAGLALAYQWRKDGGAIAGATLPTLFLNNVQDGAAGSYTVTVTNPGGSVASAGVALSVVSSGAARLVNLSTRAQVGSGDDVLIPGFVIEGAGGKTLLVRAVGPKLAAFNVPGVLADPVLTVVGGVTVVASNNDWGLFADPAALAQATFDVGAFGLAPSIRDAAVLVSLSAGPYTAPTSGVGATTGVALMELYDVNGASSSSRLINISARARVGTGADVLIPGFVVGGDVAITLLVRAVGPTLGKVPFNVAGTLADPVLTLFRGPTAIAVNDDWQQAPNQAALVAATAAKGAFALGDGERDAAFLVALNPGEYTVQVAGKDGGTGVALVELYLVGP